MARPVTGWLGYDVASDRPLVKLVAGTKKLLTEDDAGGGGGITTIDSPDGSITVTNPTGPTVSLSASGASSEPWSKPTVADSRDEEFESTTLSGSWIARQDNGTGLVTLTSGATLSYTVPAMNTMLYRAHTDRRSSWISIQASSDKSYYLLKPLTSWATYDCVWTRFVHGAVGGSAGGSGTTRLVLMADNAGNPDPLHQVKAGLASPSGNPLSIYLLAYAIYGGIAQQGNSALGPTWADYHRAVEYLVIDKVDTTYYFYGVGTGGGAVNLGVIGAPGPAMAWVGFEVRNNGNTPAEVRSFDFLRFNTGGYFALPL